MIISLDTHVLVWLYAGSLHLLSNTAKNMIEEHDLITHPINILELEYLYEIKRVTVSALDIYHDLQTKINLKLDEIPFNHSLIEALNIKWTRDPFDRIMVASSLIHDTPLITKDNLIQQHYANAVW